MAEEDSGGLSGRDDGYWYRTSPLFTFVCPHQKSRDPVLHDTTYLRFSPSAVKICRCMYEIVYSSRRNAPVL